MIHRASVTPAVPAWVGAAWSVARAGGLQSETARSRPLIGSNPNTEGLPIRATNSASFAPVAQWIERRFPKPCAQVRFLPGALFAAARSGEARNAVWDDIDVGVRAFSPHPPVFWIIRKDGTNSPGHPGSTRRSRYEGLM